MGKRPPRIGAYARVASERVKAAQSPNTQSKTLAPNPHRRFDLKSVPKLSAAMAEGRPDARVPLAEVVADCVKRWFQDALKEARNGDQAMQVLVGQMYQSGYGVARNEEKAKIWISRASKYRPSAWKVSEKRPGYNASDSDSDEVKENKN